MPQEALFWIHEHEANSLQDSSETRDGRHLRVKKVTHLIKAFEGFAPQTFLVITALNSRGCRGKGNEYVKCVAFLLTRSYGLEIRSLRPFGGRGCLFLFVL